MLQRWRSTASTGERLDGTRGLGAIDGDTSIRMIFGVKRTYGFRVISLEFSDLRSPARLGTRALATDSWACAVPNCWGAWVEEDVGRVPTHHQRYKSMVVSKNYPNIPPSQSSCSPSQSASILGDGFAPGIILKPPPPWPKYGDLHPSL